jgi:hypothetical protein
MLEDYSLLRQEKEQERRRQRVGSLIAFKCFSKISCLLSRYKKTLKRGPLAQYLGFAAIRVVCVKASYNKFTYTSMAYA